MACCPTYRSALIRKEHRFQSVGMEYQWSTANSCRRRGARTDFAAEIPAGPDSARSPAGELPGRAGLEIVDPPDVGFKLPVDADEARPVGRHRNPAGGAAHRAQIKQQCGRLPASHWYPTSLSQTTMRHWRWPALDALSGGSARATISTAPSTRTATAMYWRPAFV